MWEANPIGRGTALTAVWNGAPALFLGAPMSAVISTPGLSPNLQVVFKALTGSRKGVFGRTAALRPLRDTLFSLIGRATV